ncbi:MAG: hypothetical protein H6623_03240 [Bdellovibrionaceae bacterium]|nr:hypothetical protein [Pseudobdellovibrionaceae bacterium]
MYKIILLCFLATIVSCAKKDKDISSLKKLDNNPKDPTHLVLKPAPLIIDSPNKFDDLTNHVTPGDVTQIHSLEQSFLFNTGGHTTFYLNQKSQYGLCASPYPKARFFLLVDGEEIYFQENKHIQLKSNSNYNLIFRIKDLDCVGESYSADFSFVYVK